MIALIAPALWFALWLFPITLRGKWAISNAFRIIKPRGPINRDGSITAYAHVQERGEYRLYKLLSFVAAVPFAFWDSDPWFVMPALQLITMMAADQAVRVLLPFIDYAGHGAEIMAAEADFDTTYRLAEIERMRDDRDKRGQDVEAELARWHWLARIVFVLGRW